MDELRLAVERAQRLVAAVPADRYDLPTPCAGTVRDLLNHLVSGNISFAGTARGEPYGPDLWRRDNLGDDAAAAFRRTADDALAAWAEPGVMDRPTAFGGMPGRFAAGIWLGELTLHGWDLAKAAGLDASIPPRLVEMLWESCQAMPEEQVRQPQVFGAAVPVAADAPLEERLLCWVGRQPAWRAA